MWEDEETFEALELALLDHHLLKLSDITWERIDNIVIVKRDRWTNKTIHPFAEIAAKLGLSYVVNDAKTIIVRL